MLKKLKQEVLRANLELVKNGLVIHTWGNASGIDRKKGLIVIKPSGVSYHKMTADDMVVIDMTGKVVEGNCKPSIDAPTHLILYKSFPMIGGVVHTHSTFAVAWSQAGKDIPALGTTHADHYYGNVPCSRKLTEKEIEKDYELNTGKVIVETFKDLKPMDIPSILIYCHGPFCWGKDVSNAVYNAIALEEIAKMAFITKLLSKKDPIDQYLLDKHYNRKHGKDAYYGQKNIEKIEY